MESLPDAELVKLARSGGRIAFGQLLERHYDMIYAIAYRWCGHRENAQDIAQEVCLKLASALGQYDGRAKFTTWLYRVALNTARDFTATRAHRDFRASIPVDDLPLASADPSAQDCQEDRQLWAAVHALSDTLKEAVVLVYAEGLSHAEAAAVLGCAEGTLSWRLNEARKKLRPVLTQGGYP